MTAGRARSTASPGPASPRLERERLWTECARLGDLIEEETTERSP